jgi:hypothetical protein
MTQTRWIGTALGALVMLAGVDARADGDPVAFGRKGHVVISAERLFGFIHADTSSSSGGTTQTSHITSLSVLGNSLDLFTVYAEPRVALDFFATDRVSLGATASYFRVSESIDVPAGQTAPNPEYSGYVLAPRVGYAFAVARTVSVWPRLGFTFAHIATETANAGINPNTSQTDSTNVYAVTIEAPFVFVLTPHFFVSVAPILDLGLGGSTSLTGISANTQSTNSKETDYGILCGVGGFI